MKNLNVDLRDAFFDELYEIAKADPQVIFLTADMGAFSLERFKRDLRQQYFNVGVAEQGMVSIAAGLALEGKKVFIYSIVPFVTLRCYEQIKIDLCCMNLPVTIVGIGAGLMYGGDGPTHHAIHDVAVMRALPELSIFNPSDAISTQASARLAYNSKSPTYVRIEKGKLPLLYDQQDHDFGIGLKEIRSGKDVTIIATGVMVHKALEAAKLLEEQALSVSVIDCYRIKPMNVEALLRIIDQSQCLVTLEENSLVGGLGSAVSEIMSDCGRKIPLKRIGLGEQHCTEVACRESLHAFYKIDVGDIVKSIQCWHK